MYSRQDLPLCLILHGMAPSPVLAHESSQIHIQHVWPANIESRNVSCSSRRGVIDAEHYEPIVLSRSLLHLHLRQKAIQAADEALPLSLMN